MTRRVFVAVFFIGAAIAVAAATPQIFRTDLTVHQTTTSTGMMGGGGGAPQNSTIYFSGNAMKSSSADGNDVIMRFDQQKMVVIDNKKKTYSEMNFDELQKMMDKVGEQMKGMDPQQLEAMRKMMGQTMGDVKVTPQGAGETIAGYATEKYLINMGPMEMEVSAAPNFQIPPAYYNAMKLRMPKNPMFDASKMYDEMSKIKGMTMKSVMTMKIMNMAMTTTTLVTSVEKGSIPASTFAVPAGYTSTPFQGFQAPARGRP
jgi:hypothetical protein